VAPEHSIGPSDSISSPEENWPSQEPIASQLLHVLHVTSQEDIEPNALNLVHNVRDIAVGLLAYLLSLSNPSIKRAHGYVRDFTEIMANLDASETAKQ
jgi:hypothetical protein